MTPILEEALKNLCGVQGCMNSANGFTEMASIYDQSRDKKTLLISICQSCQKKLK